MLLFLLLLMLLLLFFLFLFLLFFLLLFLFSLGLLLLLLCFFLFLFFLLLFLLFFFFLFFFYYVIYRITCFWFSFSTFHSCFICSRILHACWIFFINLRSFRYCFWISWSCGRSFTSSTSWVRGIRFNNWF